MPSPPLSPSEIVRVGVRAETCTRSVERYLRGPKFLRTSPARERIAAVLRAMGRVDLVRLT